MAGTTPVRDMAATTPTVMAMATGAMVIPRTADLQYSFRPAAMVGTPIMGVMDMMVAMDMRAVMDMAGTDTGAVMDMMAGTDIAVAMDMAAGTTAVATTVATIDSRL